MDGEHIVEMHGQVVRVHPDSLVIRTSRGSEYSAPLAQLSGVEVSRGRQPMGFWRGALRGGLMGAALFGAVGMTYEQGDGFISPDKSAAVAGAAGGGLVPGGLIGGAIGALVKVEKWRRLDVAGGTGADWRGVRLVFALGAP